MRSAKQLLGWNTITGAAAAAAAAEAAILDRACNRLVDLFSRSFVRRLAILIFVGLLLIVLPGQAYAHGLGESQDLPLPLWLYLFGASAVLLVSFVQVVLFVDERHTLVRYPRINLLRIRPLGRMLTNGPFLLGLRLLATALFLLVVLSGFLGNQASGYNFAPTFVWITWWVGFSFFTAFIGNIWPLVNPWKNLFEWGEGVARWLGVAVEKDKELSKRYPATLGVWPALALYAAFVWIENIFEGSSVPFDLALFTILYSVLTWLGMVIFGKEAWLRNGEAFSVYFGIIARFAPTEVRVTTAERCKGCPGACGSGEGGCVNCYECFARSAPEERELNLRSWAVGLASAERITPDRLVFVLFVLASVAYDSLLPTPLLATQDLTSMQKTIGLLTLPLIFLAVYLGFVKLSQVFIWSYVSFGQLAVAYIYSLVPIAVAYQVAHYFSYLLVQGQAIISLLSDPFGWGWNLFGTAHYTANVGLIGANTVWYSQVSLILAGHMIAVYLAHVAALRLLGDPKLARRSQYPMLALMILYTVFSLWILSQPAVERHTQDKSQVKVVPTHTLTVRVSGTQGITYAGEYGPINKEGNTEQLMPTELGAEPTYYELEGEMTYALVSFTKTGPPYGPLSEGMLKVEILADNQVVTEKETSEPFGDVFVTWPPPNK